jgi:predicted ABC-type transport system involved in lysophospholipase L1 biosynthesis ATPase subunit
MGTTARKSTMMNTIGCRTTHQRSLLPDSVDVGDLNRDELADLRNSKLGFVFRFNLLTRTSALEMSSFRSVPPMPAREQGNKRWQRWRWSADGRSLPQLSGGQQQRRHRPRTGQPAPRSISRRTYRQPRQPNQHRSWACSILMNKASRSWSPTVGHRQLPNAKWSCAIG